MVRMIADYQFGKGIGRELFPDGATFHENSIGRAGNPKPGGYGRANA